MSHHDCACFVNLLLNIHFFKRSTHFRFFGKYIAIHLQQMHVSSLSIKETVQFTTKRHFETSLFEKYDCVLLTWGTSEMIYHLSRDSKWWRRCQNGDQRLSHKRPRCVRACERERERVSEKEGRGWGGAGSFVLALPQRHRIEILVLIMVDVKIKGPKN